MASNIITRVPDKLISLAGEAGRGVAEHGPSIGIVHNTAEKILGDLELLTGNAGVDPPLPGSMSVYARAKATRVAATALRNARVEAGQDLVSTSTGVLKPRLGKRWNSAWNAAGFTAGSLAVPEDPLATLLELAGYFTAHPAHEVASLGVTAVNLRAVEKGISESRLALHLAESALVTGKATRDADLKALYRRMTGLRAEVALLLGDDDPRWYAMGFSRPADGEGPGPVKTLTLTPAGAGMLIANWSRSVRAKRYRVFLKTAGTEASPVQAASNVTARTFTLMGLPSGETVEVYIVPVNDAGDGPPSAVAGAVVPG